MMEIVMVMEMVMMMEIVTVMLMAMMMEILNSWLWQQFIRYSIVQHSNWLFPHFEYCTQFIPPFKVSWQFAIPSQPFWPILQWAHFRQYFHMAHFTQDRFNTGPFLFRPMLTQAHFLSDQFLCKPMLTQAYVHSDTPWLPILFGSLFFKPPLHDCIA